MSPAPHDTSPDRDLFLLRRPISELPAGWRFASGHEIGASHCQEQATSPDWCRKARSLGYKYRSRAFPSQKVDRRSWQSGIDRR